MIIISLFLEALRNSVMLLGHTYNFVRNPFVKLFSILLPNDITDKVNEMLEPHLSEKFEKTSAKWQ